MPMLYLFAIYLCQNKDYIMYQKAKSANVIALQYIYIKTNLKHDILRSV